MKTILVIANETVGGRNLIERVREKAEEGDVRFVLVVPQNKPKHGGIIYDEAVRDAAQVRIDLARQVMSAQGIELTGEVGDPDPFEAAMDAIAEYRPDEVLVSTHPITHSGWLRRDLVERIQEASGLPVEHIVVDLEKEGLPFTVTLVVANRTVTGEELRERLREKAGDSPQEHLFIVVVPQEGGHGHHAEDARKRLRAVLGKLNGEGLLCAGMIGDPDPYTAAMNALQSFRVDDVVISTLPAEKSGWLRANLPERIESDARIPVEHVVVDPDKAKVKA
jgi:hypothetical protein